MKMFCKERSKYYTAGKALMKVLSKNEIINTLSGVTAEKLILGKVSTYDDSNQAFILAVEQVLQNGGNVHSIVEDARYECARLLEENSFALSVIAEKQPLSTNEILRISNLGIDLDFEC